jgi:hypothetical protein
MALGAILQITIAIMMVILLLVIGFAVFNMETIKVVQESNKQKRKVEIFKGIKDLRMLPDAGETYNTSDSALTNYKDLTLSVNQKSGAEFTYNFWLRINDWSVFADDNISAVTTDAGISEKDFVLLLRGDSTVYNYKNLCGVSKNDVMVKCPLIKMSQGGDVLSVEFNTVATPDATHEQSRNTCSDLANKWDYMNNHKIAITDFKKKNSLYQGKWFMITTIIQDTNPTDPLPIRNKARCRIFINGVMELDRYVDGKLAVNAGNPQILLQNRGNLYVAPSAKWKIGTTSKQSLKLAQTGNPVYMADLSYYNYALMPEEIKSIFAASITQAIAPSAGQESAANLWDAVSYTGAKKQLTSF